MINHSLIGAANIRSSSHSKESVIQKVHVSTLAFYCDERGDDIVTNKDGWIVGVWESSYMDIESRENMVVVKFTDGSVVVLPKGQLEIITC